jgi:hypothetical protein
MKKRTPNYKDAYKIKVICKLRELEIQIKPLSRKDFIPYPDVFAKLGRSLALNKVEIWSWLNCLSEEGYIQMVFSKGIKLNSKSKRIKVVV